MIIRRAKWVWKVLRDFYLIILMLLWLFPHEVFSQDYFFDKYSVADGLSQSTIYDIFQDQNDYIWLGTREGVSRFDGNEFINFSLNDGLAENGVQVISQDADGNLWFGHSGGGVSFYDGRKFRIFSKSGETFNSDITSILFDNDQNLWITSELSGAVKISEIRESLLNSKHNLYIGNDLSDRIFGLYQDKSGKLFFITDAFLKTYNSEKDEFTSYHIDGMPTYFLITSMLEDSRNNLWFGTYNGGFYKYNIRTDSFKVYDIRDGLGSNWITTIYEDSKGRIWIGTWGGGITLLDHGQLSVMDTSNGLHDMKIRKIIEDRGGNILIGTNENGLSIFKSFQFLNFFPKHGLKDPQVWSIIQDKSGKFWFGTSKGISIYDPLKPKEKQFNNFYKLSDDRILYLEEDVKSRIWIGTDKQGVFTYNSTNKVFTYEQFLNSYIFSKSSVVTNLESDKNGNIWAGLLDGLVIYNYDNRKVRYLTQTNGLSGNEITALYYAPDGKMWIGSRGKGLDFSEDDSIYHLSLKETFTPTSITSDRSGYLWVGTEARGIYQIDPFEKKIVKVFNDNSGLLANLINLVITDEQDRVYIGTNQGLNVYEQSEDIMYAYNHKNGFVGIETKPGGVFLDNNGKLWFGTIKGVTFLNPDKIKTTGLDPLTHITNFRVNLEERELKPGTNLRHDENNVIFKYISICLTNPEAVAYRIMLEGADNDWRPETSQTTVTYPSLSPGHYKFKVKGRNSEGTWNKTAVSFEFQIRPPFYKTLWFILVCIFVGAALMILYIKIRERNLVREKNILEKKVIDRTAVVVAQKEQLARKNKNITDSIRYAKRIQVAILPPRIPYEDTFVLFKPKDIVSGDFYWLESANKKEFIAAVDCTGHGVPGAFMSIIGSNLLNKIVKEENISRPSLILDKLNTEIIRNLKTSEDGDIVYDGMDLALVCYDKENSIIEFAGAFNPLIIIQDGDFREIKGDRDSIGRSSIAGRQRKFTNHKIKVSSGDIIYIFSDGYADQFGGTDGKKYKLKTLKKLLFDIHKKPVQTQKKILEETLNEWSEGFEQVDDILIIGRKF